MNKPLTAERPASGGEVPRTGVVRDLPGHIKKAFRSIERFIPVVDLIVELLDARMPYSSRLHGLTARLGKTSLIVLGKADLADRNVSQAWVDWFEARNEPCMVFQAKEANSGKQLIARIRAMAMHSSIAKTRKVRRIMVIGIPNVGKSTLINLLAGRRAARVANLPGVTRNIQWIKLAGELELLDLPGVLDFSLLRSGNVLRMINTLPGPTDDPESLAATLCAALKAAGLMAHVPGLEECDGEASKFLITYAQRLNFLAKNSVPDTRRAAGDFVKKFQQGAFGALTLETPESIESKEEGP